MRALILALLLSLFVGMGMAGATIPNGTGGVFGPYGGFTNPGTIEANGLYVHTSADIASGLRVWGDANIAGTLTTGVTVQGGTINHWAMMGANLPFTAATGTGVFDWSNSTGAFTTSSGTNTLSGNTVISGTKTFTTGTGLTTISGAGTQTGIQTFTAAPVFNAGFVVPSGQTADTTTADKLKEAGVIVSTAIPVKMTFDAASVTANANRSFTIMDGAWQILEIDEVHGVVGGANSKLKIGKATGTQTPNFANGGLNCLATSIDLTAAVNNVVTPTLNTTATNYQFANHDRMFLQYSGTPGSLCGEVTIWMKRI